VSLNTCEESMRGLLVPAGNPLFLLNQMPVRYIVGEIMVKKYIKTDGTVTVKTDDGKIATNLPSDNRLSKAKLNNAVIQKQLISESKELEKDAEQANETLNSSLDALIVVGEKIDELEDERLTLRIKADEENRPLTEPEIEQVKIINEKISNLRAARKELINSNKDIRMEKADADVTLHANHLELDKANGVQHVHDYESEELGEAQAVGQHESNSEEWHAQRKKVIGGSDVSAIMGTNKWTNYNKLLATKLGLIAPSTSKPIAANLGDIYEPIIQYQFAKTHSAGTKEPYTVYHTKSSWINNSNPTHGANMDGLYDSSGTGSAPDGILEIKAVSNLGPWKEGPPAYYRQQVLWYMHVTGLRKGKIVALFNQEDYNEYDIIPEEGEIENIVEKVSEFEKHLAKERRKLEKTNTTQI
jgi:putative phage-type endonuclease